MTLGDFAFIYMLNTTLFVYNEAHEESYIQF